MRLPRELRDQIYQIVLDTGVLEVPRGMKYIRENEMLLRPRYTDPRFFFLTPDLLLVSCHVYEEARRYVNKYTIIEIAPLSRLPSLKALMMGIFDRASHFHQVKELVIPQDILNQTLTIPRGEPSRYEFSSGFMQNHLEALEVVVWPNGGDHPRSRDDREAAVRLYIHKPSLKLIDVEYDIVEKESEEDKGKGPVIDGTHTWRDWVPTDIHSEEYKNEVPIEYGRHDWRGWAPREGLTRPIPVVSEPGIPKAGSRRYVSRNSGKFLGSYH